MWFSKKKETHSGFPGDCSEEQLQALKQFREYVSKQGLSEDKYDDVYLLRFLRARQFDMPKVQLMWNTFIEFRKTEDLDHIFETFQYKELNTVTQYYPHGYHKTDKQGRPVYYERLGALDVKTLFQHTTKERFLKYRLQSYEMLLGKIFPSASKKKGERVDQYCTILDLSGGKSSILSKDVINFIKHSSGNAADNYPEILGKMYIVNAPFWFKAAWATIRIFIDEKTKKKINIEGTGFITKLQQDIDIENIPEYLGGQSKESILRNVGPWNPNGDCMFPGVEGETPVVDEKKYEGQQEEYVDDKEEENKLQE